jgi:hypothetical protein
MVVMTGMLAWTFDLYSPYLRTGAADTATSAQVVASNSAIERNAGGA